MFSTLGRSEKSNFNSPQNTSMLCESLCRSSLLAKKLRGYLFPWSLAASAASIQSFFEAFALISIMALFVFLPAALAGFALLFDAPISCSLIHASS
jgi:hypothetical protein